MAIQKPAPGRGPLYTQVRELIVERLVSGYWQPGDILPSEVALGVEFSVSQGTVRKALDVLTAENLVVRHQGKGTFVATHTPQRELFHFFNLVSNDGSKQLPDKSRQLSLERRRGSREECSRLALPAGSNVICFVRVRMLVNRPAVYETITVPAKTFPSLGQDNELPNNLYQIYEEEFGVTIHRAVEQLRAVTASPIEARHLIIPAGTPLIEIDRLAETLDKIPVEWRISRCDTRDHYYLSEIV